MPKASAEAATKAAAAQGVKVTTFSASWNDSSRLRRQHGHDRRAKGDGAAGPAVAAATDIATFLSPRAAVVEYALTREGGAPASIRVSLGKDTTVTISRTHAP